MNLAAIAHGIDLPFRQPIARNRIRFRLLAADGDLAACALVLWKRSEPYPDSRRTLSMRPRYRDGVKAEWVCDAAFPEEAHYIKYFFRLEDRAGQTLCFCEHGFSEGEPASGFFEVLQVFDCDIPRTPAWATGAVYYQVFPERFAVGNPAKALRDYAPWDAEPTRENFLGGDLNGIRAKLPYLEELGVQCLYLTPIFAAAFNHKYATTDYFRIDPDFGDADDLIALVDSAHARGIRVLLDGVFNHTGTGFAPFRDVVDNGVSSAYRDWFHIKRFPVEIDPACYECVGDYPHMPRLNTGHPDVRAFILKVMLHWLDEAGVDGWRLDVADEVDMNALRWLRDCVKARHPEALLLGETWGDAGRLVAEGGALDAAMNYLFRGAMVDYFAKDAIDEAQLGVRLERMLMKYPDEVNLRMYNCLSSHDTARFLTEAAGERWRLMLAIAFQLLFPGSPAIYYGDEIGMEGGNDPLCRGGMAWDRADGDLLQWSKRWIQFRKGSLAVRQGGYRTLLADSGRRLFAFERAVAGETIIAAFNRGDVPQTLDFADAAGAIVPPRSVKIIKL
ncbi:glycoside hydrolase family 13 protein [Bacillota bacterium Meth-B3]